MLYQFHIQCLTFRLKLGHLTYLNQNQVKVKGLLTGSEPNFGTQLMMNTVSFPGWSLNSVKKRNSKYDCCFQSWRMRIIMLESIVLQKMAHYAT